MSKLVSNYTANGSSTTDEYGTFVVLNRFLQGDVVEGFAVVANGTPNLTVLVQPGSGRITTGTYPSSYGYLISHDTSAGESVTISTPAASPRIDYIVAYIDKGVAGSTSGANVNNTNNVLKFAAVAGTPAGSPNVPTVGQIQTAIGAANPYIILGQVSVGASVTQITNLNITDKRIFVAARNGGGDATPSYVDSGCVWSATSGLAAAMTSGVVYLNVGGVMVPITIASISSNTFTANKDTYVDVSVSGAVVYTEVSNNATTGMTLVANNKRLGKVVTNGSGIVRIEQVGYDPLGNRFYNTVRSVPSILIAGTGGTLNFSGTADSLSVSTRWAKPMDIMTLAGSQVVRFQPYLRPQGAGGNTMYRISYIMRKGSAFQAIEPNSSTSVGQTPNLYTFTGALDQTYDDYYATYDLAAIAFDSLLRVDMRRDAGNAADTNAAGTELEGVYFFYNKDYSKSA